MAKRTVIANPLSSQQKIGIGALLLLGAGGGAYYFLMGKRNIPYGLKITGYRNTTKSGPLITAPLKLDVDLNDVITVYTKFKYYGVAQPGAAIHVATWVPGGTLNKVDEKDAADLPVPLESAVLPKTYSKAINITIRHSDYQSYHLYFKLGGIKGEDYYSPYLLNVIVLGTGGERPPAPNPFGFSNLQVVPITTTPLHAGEIFQYNVVFDYNGPARNFTVKLEGGKQVGGIMGFNTEGTVFSGSYQVPNCETTPIYGRTFGPFGWTVPQSALDKWPGQNLDISVRFGGLSVDFWEDYAEYKAIGVVPIAGAAPPEDGGDGTATGEITKAYINKAPEGTEIPLPATVAADGHTFEAGAYYKNDSSVSYVGGIEVKVTKPNGSVVTPAVDWAGMAPGETLRHHYNIAAVDQVGPWAIAMRFLTQSGVVLDTFNAVMTATGPTGSITKAYINKTPEGSEIALPATVAADGNTFEVGAEYKNTCPGTPSSGISYNAGIEVRVTKPDGSVVAPAVDYALMHAGDSLQHAYQLPKVDQGGAWTIAMRFLTDKGVVLATFNGVMTASGMTGEITRAYIHKGSAVLDLPCTVKADGQTFEVGVQYKNTWAATIKDAGVEVVVTEPDNSSWTQPVDWADLTKDQLYTHEYQFRAVNKVGPWKIAMRFLTKTGVELDKFDSVMTAISAVEQMKLWFWVDNEAAGFIEVVPWGTIDGTAHSYDKGTSVTLKALVYNAAAYQFTKWLDPANVLTAAQRTSPIITIQMNKDITLTATYTYIYEPPPPELPPEAYPIPTTPGYWYYVVFTDNSAAWFTAEYYFMIDPYMIKKAYGPYVVV